MGLLFRLILLCTCALLACTKANLPLQQLRVGGWVSHWDFAASMAHLRHTDGLLDDVFLFVALLDAAGNPVLVDSPATYQRAAMEIRARHAIPWLTLVNDIRELAGPGTLKSATLVHDVLSDDARREQHRAAIVALARSLDVGGVDIDYENLNPADRQAFSQFITELAAELHRSGLQLSVTVQPKRQESLSVGPGAADWSALCRVVDRLQIMLYNEHNERTDPGPVASLGFIKNVMEYGLTQCKARQLVPAFKVVGMEWGANGFRDVTFSAAMLAARASGTALKRTLLDQVPTFSYRDAKTLESRTVYFEDTASLLQKVYAILQYRVSGVVFWSLSREDPAFWQAMGAARSG